MDGKKFCLILFFFLFSLFSPHRIFAQSSSDTRDFVRASGDHFVIDKEDREFFPKGFNIQGFYWKGGNVNKIDSVFIIPDVSGVDPPGATGWLMDTKATWGANVFRLLMSYSIFEDDTNPLVYKATGWDWLDSNVLRAYSNKTKLILTMTVPQGGFQSVGGAAYATWDSPALQIRLRALWKAIATRYRDSTSIMAYDVLNEPNPTHSGTQWIIFAQDLTNAVREVDVNHTVMIENVHWIVDSGGNSPPDPTVIAQTHIFTVNDDTGGNNVFYDVHDYLPTAYALQQELGAGDTFYPSVTTDKDWFSQTLSVTGRDSNYIERNLLQLIQERSDSNIPVTISEWGSNRSTYEDTPLLGGETYTRDFIEILLKHRVSFMFFPTFHELTDFTRVFQSPVPNMIKLMKTYLPKFNPLVNRDTTLVSASFDPLPGDTDAWITLPIASSSSGENFFQVTLNEGDTTGGALQSAADTFGRGADASIRGDLLGAEDSFAVFLYMRQAHGALLLSLRSDTSSLDTANLPGGILDLDTGHRAFSRTVLLGKFGDAGLRMVGNRNQQNKIGDTFAYTLIYYLSDTTVDFYAEMGFDTTPGRDSFTYWRADSYGGKWNQDTSVSVFVDTGFQGGLKVHVVGIIYDFLGGLGGISVSNTSSTTTSSSFDTSADTLLPIASVVVVSAGTTAKIAPVHSSVDSFTQIMFQNISVSTGTLSSQADSFGTNSNFEITSPLLDPQDTVTIFGWTSETSPTVFLSLRTDSACMDTSNLPLRISTSETALKAFTATSLLLEFSNSKGQLLGDSVTTTSIADTFVYTLVYELSPATTRLYSELGFDTSTGSSDFAFYFSDTFCGKWTKASSVQASAEALSSGGLRLRVTTLTIDLPGGIGGSSAPSSSSSTSGGLAASGGSLCLLERLAPFPFLNLTFRLAREEIIQSALGRWFVEYYYDR